MEDLPLHGLSAECALELPDPGLRLPKPPGRDHVRTCDDGRLRPLLEEPLPLAHDRGTPVQLTGQLTTRDLAAHKAPDPLAREGPGEEPVPTAALPEFPLLLEEDQPNLSQVSTPIAGTAYQQ